MTNKHYFQEVPEEYHEPLCGVGDEEEERDQKKVEVGGFNGYRSFLYKII